MKKLLLSALLLGSLSVSALEVKLEKVSYGKEVYGTQAERSAEVKYRKAKLEEMRKLGYAFDGMVMGAKGKFMKFVK